MAQITSRFGKILRLYSSHQRPQTSCNWSERPAGPLFKIFFAGQIYGGVSQFFRGAEECPTHFLFEITRYLLFIAKTLILIYFIS
jgi:hypothetical protein